MSASMSARLTAAILLALGACAPAPATDNPPGLTAQGEWTNLCSDWDDWDKPALPFRVADNTYYVGTCGISAILVTGDEGHVLIDSGTEKGAEVVLANIRELGFDPRDVKILLHSHEHFDHVGGMARLQQVTGARLLASAEAAPVLSSGETAANDPQAGMHDPFAAARGDGIVTSGEPVRLGNLALMPVATPGHTNGALSWQWTSRPGEDGAVPIVYADSLSPVSSDDYRFGDHPEYLQAYRNGLLALAELDCRIILTPHPSASGMRANIVENGRISENPNACRDYASGAAQRLDARLAEEAGEE